MDLALSYIILATSDFDSFLRNPINLIIGSIIIGSLILFHIIKMMKLRKWRKKELEKLALFSDSITIELIQSNNYIPTMGQIDPPHDTESISVSPKRFLLIDEFIKEFESERESLNKKRYIVMGGSGMGKTTFSAALFYKYISTIKKEKRCPIFIESLSRSDVLHIIQEINFYHDVQKSIIILDALDENFEAAKDLRHYMNLLEYVTKDFKFVIITCRTQFFKDKNTEPREWTFPISEDTNKIFHYETIYVSPFTDEETDDYLKKKYKKSQNKYNSAIRITEKFKDVMSRPMILSFMDELLENRDIEKRATVELYTTIIDEWFDREIKIKRIGKNELYSFSKKIALFLYDNWLKSGNAFLSIDEYESFIKENGYEKSPYSFKDRSLLNRKIDGSIKFSHRSFWEFFLAINVFEHPGLFFAISEGLEMAKHFVDEIKGLYSESILLDCIDYNGITFFSIPNYSCSSLQELTSILNDLYFKYCSSYYYKRPKKELNNRLYSLWEMMIPVLLIEKTRYKQWIESIMSSEQVLKRFIKINFESDEQFTETPNVDLIKILRDIYLKIFKILDSFQHFFIEHDFNVIRSITHTLLEIDGLEHNLEYEKKGLKIKPLKNEVVFNKPISFLDETDWAKISSTSIFLTIAMGFSQSITQEFIDICLNDDRDELCVCIESKDIDEIVRFFNDLKRIKLKHCKRLFVKITHLNTTVYVLIGGGGIAPGRNEMISSMIKNMISAKNYKLDNE